jgi:hypothetical protein
MYFFNRVQQHNTVTQNNRPQIIVGGVRSAA